MKIVTGLLVAVVLVVMVLGLSGCGSTGGDWAGTPNPLDTPGSGDGDRTNWRPAAHGHFGPFGQGGRYGFLP